MSCYIFPEEFEAEIYRNLHPDLQYMNFYQLQSHYENFGRNEGRIANSLKNRSDFSSLIQNNMKSLEIGPFANPIITGNNVDYADYLDNDALIARATSIGLDPSRVPFIKYVLSNTSLDEIDVEYDAVISSHNIEHQPDLVAHLAQVHRLVQKKQGRYFLLIPDKRYCFDRNIKETTIADILEAHENKMVVHSLKSIIEHRALTVHNNSHTHWMEGGNEQRMIPNYIAIKTAIAEWKAANGGYIDVHAHQFTPDSFVTIINLLRELGYLSWEVERLYPTRRDSNEFWVILRSL